MSGDVLAYAGWASVTGCWWTARLAGMGPWHGALARCSVLEREQGTPQGGPLSPLLAKVLHDEVDKALEKRGASILHGMPMTATFTCVVRKRVSGCFASRERCIRSCTFG